MFDEQPDAFPQAHRLALELECLLLSCQDNAAVSKWWDSAHEALEQWRQFCAIEPAPCTDDDKWNCKYCGKIKTCEAIKDSRSFGKPVGAAPLPDEVREIVEQQRDELLVALEATVEAIRLFRNEPQLERLVSLRATAGYVAMDAAMDRGTDAIDAARGVK